MGSILRMLNVEIPVVLAQAIGILVLLVLFKMFFHRPLQDVLRKRREMISGKFHAAEELQANAESLRKQYETHLANISEEAKSRIDQAMKDAEIMQNRLIESTQAEIQNLYRQQERELALERERTRRELRSEIMDLAVMAAAKALRSRITPAVQSAVIDQVLEELDKLPQNS